MAIIGIQSLVFGVEDLSKAESFLIDFGLTQKPCMHSDKNSFTFTTQNGGQIIIKSIDDSSLPPAFEAGSTLRILTWAVNSQDTLDELAISLKDVTGFYIDNNIISCVDPNGLTHKFALSELNKPNIKPIPLNQWGDYQRVDEPSPIYEQANPVNIGHVVFFCEDLVAMEDFLVNKLGFYISDKYLNDRGVFLRTQENSGHHNIFILKIPNKDKGLNHVAFTVRDIHEVFGGGLAMEKKKWATFIGPGRHPISSAYFWYIKSPCGGAFEYYSNEDLLTANWQPRQLTHSVEAFTEWAIEGGIDYETRRQYKHD